MTTRRLWFLVVRSLLLLFCQLASTSSGGSRTNTGFYSPSANSGLFAIIQVVQRGGAGGNLTETPTGPSGLVDFEQIDQSDVDYSRTQPLDHVIDDEFAGYDDPFNHDDEYVTAGIDADDKHQANDRKSNLDVKCSVGESQSTYSGSHQGLRNRKQQKSLRHASDLVTDLLNRPEEYINEESRHLRELIMERTIQFGDQLKDESRSKLPEPRSMLHFLAPKIPAIKHSPDSSLRITSVRSDIDPGIAACLLGALGHVCELYEKENSLRMKSNVGLGGQTRQRISFTLIDDRRLEQVLECAVGGINVLKRVKEYEEMQQGSSLGKEHGKDLIDSMHATLDEGLSVRDACRVAWGISMLDIHQRVSYAGLNISELVIALALRTRELLLARVNLLRQAVMESCGLHGPANERIGLMADELAEDLACTLWAFACVKACTGINFGYLFDTCCSILSLDTNDIGKPIKDSDDSKYNNTIKDEAIGRTTLENSDRSSQSLQSLAGDNSKRGLSCEDPLLGRLSPNELTDCLWAVALHGKESCDESTKTIFCNLTVYRILYFVEEQKTLETQIDDSNVDEGFVHENSRVSPLEDQNGECRAAVIANQPAEGSLASIGTDMSVRTEKSESIDTSGALHLYSDGELSSLTALRRRILSPHDLCCVAWAVTELDHPMQSQVSEFVLESFIDLGCDSLHDLSGGDLASLAWICAKHVVSRTRGKHVESELRVITWIAEHVEVATSDDEHAADMLRFFQPPELSRLLCSVAIVTTCPQRTHDGQNGMQNLAYRGLVAAASKSHLFSAEDMSRIAWSFFALSDLNTVTKQATVASLLGKVLSVAESCLLRWENGNLLPDKAHSSVDQKEVIPKYVPFLGRNRFHLPFTDHRLGDFEADYLEDVSPTFALDKGRLPLLRDLPVDPATLCKLASSLSQITEIDPSLKLSESILRIAIKLFSSHNGRLLTECSPSDCVRLCEAAALYKSASDPELITLFARRAVYFLNSVSSNRLFASGALDLDPSDISTLLWSLGKLGVKYLPSQHESALAHRHLRLVTRLNLSFDNDHKRLSSKMKVKMFSGLTMMNIVQGECSFLRDFLSNFQTAMPSISTESDAIDTIDAAVRLQCNLLEHDSEPILLAMNHNVSNDDEANTTTTNETVFVDDADLTAQCKLVLCAALTRCIVLVDDFSNNGLRQLLSIITVTPVRCDDLVNNIEKEVEKRAAQLNMTNHENSVLDYPSFNTEILKQMIDTSESDEKQSVFLSGLRSFFQSSAKNLDSIDLLGSENLASEIAFTKSSDLQAIAQKVTHILHQAHALLNHSLNDKSRNPSRWKDEFDLFACMDLIEQYRRIDFEKGIRKSRQDQKHRRDIAKRALNRHLPRSIKMASLYKQR